MQRPCCRRRLLGLHLFLCFVACSVHSEPRILKLYQPPPAKKKIPQGSVQKEQENNVTIPKSVDDFATDNSRISPRRPTTSKPEHIKDGGESSGISGHPNGPSSDHFNAEQPPQPEPKQKISASSEGSPKPKQQTPTRVKTRDDEKSSQPERHRPESIVEHEGRSPQPIKQQSPIEADTHPDEKPKQQIPSKSNVENTDELPQQRRQQKRHTPQQQRQQQQQQQQQKPPPPKQSQSTRPDIMDRLGPFLGIFQAPVLAPTKQLFNKLLEHRPWVATSSDNNSDQIELIRPTTTSSSSLAQSWKTALVWLSSPRGPNNKYLIPSVAITTTSLAIFKVCRSQPVRRALYFWRHMGPVVAHYKFAQWWVNQKYPHPHDREKRDEIYQRLHEKYSRPSLNLVLHLRGLYVKIGQVLSSRPDFMPPQYTSLLETVQDSIPQWPIEDVRSVVEGAFEQQFGLAFDDVFESMDATALGSASIGQVHRAVLKDKWAELPGYSGGKVVAVKVMHAGAKEQFKHDFQVFRWLSRIALPNWMGFLRELERRLMTEFDYRREADSLSTVRRNMILSPYRNQVCVPEPLERLCCEQVLVMEMLNGVKLVTAIEDELARDFGDRDKATRFMAERKKEVLSGEGDSNALLASIGFLGKIRLLSLVRKCRRYISLLVDVHGHQILVDGCFNGDPHFGNILRLEDGRLGLIDYGQTRRLNDEERLAIARVICALDMERSEANVAEAMRDVGFEIENEEDNAAMLRYAKIFFDSDQEGIDLGYATPQEYFTSLMAKNPLTNIPDSAVFVARASFLFRGMGHAIGMAQIKTAKSWWKHANQALVEANVSLAGLQASSYK